MEDPRLTELITYLKKVPSVQQRIGSGFEENGYWWVKLQIDIEHPLAWNVVQELGFVLNYISRTEPLPTIFKPISPPPYLNGGPKDFLSWVIECRDRQFEPTTCMKWLEGRLPRPVDDLSQWTINDDENSEG